MNFSFGSLTSNKDKTAPAPAADSTAPKPAVPNFNFNFNQSKTSSTTAPAASASTDQPPVNLPIEIKDKKIKDVLETMEAMVEQQARQFQIQAQQVARWDRSIYECIDFMTFLQEQIDEISTKQKDLKDSAISLLKEQDEFIQTLTSKVSSETDSENEISRDQRAQLYENAKQLGEKFQEMEKKFKEIVDETEQSGHSETSSDMDVVCQISNLHLDSLQWISTRCSELEQKLTELEQNSQL